MGDWAQDNDSGSAGYTTDQAARVLAVLERHRGRANALTRRDLCQLAQLDQHGRTLRAILRDLDGHPRGVLLATDEAEGLLWIADSIDEAEKATRKLEAMRNALTVRINRRRLNGPALVAAQPSLF